MKSKLKHIHKLDYVLHFLANNSYKSGHISNFEILEQTKGTKLEMSIELLDMILRKLDSDKYVEYKVINKDIGNNISTSLNTYRINFEGLVFDELGGYNALYLENNKIRNIQRW